MNIQTPFKIWVGLGWFLKSDFYIWILFDYCLLLLNVFDVLWEASFFYENVWYNTMVQEMIEYKVVAHSSG